MEEIIPNLPIPTAMITKVNDNTVDQAPTPNMETVAPSMATPKPGPWQSSHVSNQGTRPNYKQLHNQSTWDRAMVTHKIVTELETLKEADGWPDWPIWQQAMNAEMEQHKEIGPWDLVQLPTGRTDIGCRWVYAVKTTPSGNFDKAKACYHASI